MKCPRCQRENPPEAKFCLECAASINGATPAPSSSAQTKAEIESLRRSLSEALEQQTATSEILGIISRSPTDVQSVFDVIARSAVRLCQDLFSAVLRFDGTLLNLAAHYNLTPDALAAFHRAFPAPPSRNLVAGRAVLDRAVVHIPDVEADRELGGPAYQAGQSILAVPMLRDGQPLGSISVARLEQQPFTDKQIALLQTFADQAVIAIENVRLFNETKEALEQQTATSEILRVISSSPTDLQPVFDTIVRNAARVCGAFDAVVVLADGEEFVQRAYHGPIAAVLGARYPLRGTVGGRAILEARVVHVENLAEASDYPASHELAQRVGYRTTLSVPLLRDGAAIGAIGIRRTEVQPFTDNQIALLQTFADQAVIAIENVRLFTELQEKNRALTAAHAKVTDALEQQTATSEILSVISSSHTDLQPVFDAILHSAGRLCDATFGALQLFDGEHLTLDGHFGISPEDVAMLQAQVFPMRPDIGSSIGRAIIRRATVHIEDIRRDPEFKVSALQTREGYRTALSVPMLRGDIAVGVINLWRRDVRPFSQTHIDMVQTFADQAVIAIENVRLFTELQEKNRALTQADAQVTEALEQQTATSEILRVISSSPTDVQPIFETITRSAARLCDATVSGLARFDGNVLEIAATYGYEPRALEYLRRAHPRRPGRDTGWGRAVLERRVIHVHDVTVDTEYQHSAIGHRTLLAVPLLREQTALGAIAIWRRDVKLFSDQSDCSR